MVSWDLYSGMRLKIRQKETEVELEFPECNIWVIDLILRITSLTQFSWRKTDKTNPEKRLGQGFLKIV